MIIIFLRGNGQDPPCEQNHPILFRQQMIPIHAYLFISSAAIFALGLIIWQLTVFRKKHPNAEMLIRLYQMIAPDK
jgi:hypothetical protein